MHPNVLTVRDRLLALRDSASRTYPFSRIPPVAFLTAVALASLWLALAAVHELAVIATANLLAWISGWGLIRDAVVVAPGDDVHALLALQMVGDLQFDRLAINLPGAGALVTRFPGLFAPSTWLPGDAWISAVFTTSSSAVGVRITRLLVNAIFIVFGVILTSAVERRRSLRHIPSWHTLAVAGLCLGILLQTYGAVSQLHVTWADGSGGGMLLSMVATKLFGLGSDAYGKLNFGGGVLLSLVVNLAVLALSFAFALKVRNILRMAPAQNLSLRKVRQIPLLVLPGRVPGPLTLVLAVLLFQTPLKHTTAFVPSPEPEYEQSGVIVEGPAPVAEEPSAPKPSVVTVAERMGGFEYRVNGKRTAVRGIGYNFTISDEDLESRIARYSRDFAAMRAYGVNTIIGWDQQKFDEILLSKAAQNGLGVILPFDLRPLWAYDDPDFRSQLMEEIRVWVERYKASPALRMWGLGNEVVHGIGNTNSPKAKAFARFLVEAADYVHRLDPNHPVIYRDAEDVFLAPVSKALATGGSQRPWFVYGMNFFTNRIGPALQSGPANQLQYALLVSEFAPAGVAPQNRPEAYLYQWGLIRSFPRKVLGACAYVWTTDGPEPLDRSFGMTDENGVPVDGSISALASAFLREKSAEEELPRHAKFFRSPPQKGALMPIRWATVSPKRGVQ